MGDGSLKVPKYVWYRFKVCRHLPFECLLTTVRDNLGRLIYHIYPCDVRC